MSEQTIRTVVFKSGDWWIIQGLEYDFATCTKRLEDVPGELRRWLLVLFAASQKYGIEPFTGYSPAPRKYWEMYEKAPPWAEQAAFFELPIDSETRSRIEVRLSA